MSPAENTVDEAASLIRERIDELDAERAQLARALASLTGEARAVGGPAARAGDHGRQLGRRRRRGGTRADQAVSMIGANPGVSASEIAKRMKIKPNYLYRVLAELEKEGKVRKEGRAYHPVAEVERCAPRALRPGRARRPPRARSAARRPRRRSARARSR